MILPVLKITSSTNSCGQDILRTQVANSTPPAASHLNMGDAMNDIMDIIGNHHYIDDMAGTSTPVQFNSRPGEVSICEADTKIISFFSPFSQKLLRTILRNMKLPTMMKKYFDAYTLYVGQNTLQIFANFEDDPPITSSRLSSVTSSKSFSKDDEESDTDSGVGRASPTQHDDLEDCENERNGTEAQDDDDEFTVLWYGTDVTGDFDDISKVKGIFPDIQIEDHSDEDPDDISEEETEDAPPYYATESDEEKGEICPGPPTRIHQGTDYSTTDSEDGEEGIFPDLSPNTYHRFDEDDIAEEEDDEDEILSGLRITSCQSLATSAPTPTIPPPIEIFEIKDHFYDTVTNEDEDEDMARVVITNLESLSEENRTTSIYSSSLELESLCYALSNISINQLSSSKEYVEKENDTKDEKFKEEPIITVDVFPPPVPKPRTKTKPPPGRRTKSGQCLKDTGALRNVCYLAEHKPRVETTEDPLSDPKPEKKTVEFNPEQAHNILTPYYRTIDEPWDQQTENDPRITLAAMFKTNSKKFREDSVTHQCSRPACRYKTDCYWEREWEQRQGRGMYNYTQCI